MKGMSDSLTPHSCPAVVDARPRGFDNTVSSGLEFTRRRSAGNGSPQPLTLPELWQLHRRIRHGDALGDDNSNRDENSFRESLISGSTQRQPLTVMDNLSGLRGIFASPFSILLLAFPFGIISALSGWDSQYTFWLNFLALIPLAKILGDATEELDASLGSELLSGLLNATFGNAVECIITISAIRNGELEVVKASLLGSVLSNMLLVLGMSFFVGGLFGKKDSGKFHFIAEKEQVFLANGALCSVSMLLLSSMSFTLPTVFKFVGHEEHVLELSRVGAFIMMLSYIMYLIFQLFTHRKTFSQGDDTPSPGASSTPLEKVDEQGDDDGPNISLGVATALLCFTTLLTAVSSEFLVEAVRDVSENSALTESFIGVILLPIVGNACEHMAAVRFAIQDRPGLAVSIAVGSSTQIALFVVPFAVIFAWASGKDMDLDFGGMHTAVMTLSVLILMTIVLDGRSNWLEGWMLMAAYAFIAAMYFLDQSEDLLHNIR